MIEERKENTRANTKKESKEIQAGKEQSKFFVDLSKEQAVLKNIFELLEKANNKSYGAEIIFKDLAVYAIGKIGEKDILKIQEDSMSEMEKIERLLHEHNEKNKTSLSLGEFLVKKLGIT